MCWGTCACTCLLICVTLYNVYILPSFSILVVSEMPHNVEFMGFLFIHDCTGTCSREWCLHLCNLANTTEQALCFVVLSEWTNDVTSDSKSTAHNSSSNTQPVGAHVAAKHDELDGHRSLIHAHKQVNECESAPRSAARKYSFGFFASNCIHVSCMFFVYVLRIQFCSNIPLASWQVGFSQYN